MSSTTTRKTTSKVIILMMTMRACQLVYSTFNLRIRIGHGLSYSGILFSKNMHYRSALITERSERYITSRFNIYRYGCQSDLSDCCRSISISVFNMAHVCTGLKQVLLRQQSSKRFRETDFPHGGSCFLYAGHRNRYFLRLLGSRDNYNDCLNDWKTSYKAKRSFGLMPSNPCSVKLSNELN